MKSILLGAACLFFCTGILAQHTTVGITGIVADSLTLKGIPGATIEISGDGLTRTIVSNADGKFSVANLPYSPRIVLTASAVGYQAFIKNIIPVKGANSNNVVIKLWQTQNTLSTVVVTANTTPAMQFGIDRKIFNVEKNITAQGGTAVDVMKNIPSLSADVDGNVEMRNSTPQILIDGRPTILTLDQVPADDIEKVELVTNPYLRHR